HSFHNFYTHTTARQQRYKHDGFTIHKLQPVVNFTLDKYLAQYIIIIKLFWYVVARYVKSYTQFVIHKVGVERFQKPLDTFAVRHPIQRSQKEKAGKLCF